MGSCGEVQSQSKDYISVYISAPPLLQTELGPALTHLLQTAPILEASLAT